MEKKYSEQLLTDMKNRQYTIQENGIEILIKPIPETDTPGMLDPRLYDSMAPMFKGVKGAIAKKMMKKNQDVQKSARTMRKMMNGITSIPIVNDVETKKRALKINDREIPVRIYTSKSEGKEEKPIFYYIHGGGFVAGSPDVVEEMCKMMVEKTGCVSVTLDYRLAPEHPYPAGFDDCYDVLIWIYKNATKFGGDPEKICISGDSAGGNLATVCAMKDRDKGRQMVKVQALFYPTVDMASMADPASQKGLDAYEINQEHAHIIKPMIEMLGGMGGGMSLETFLGVKDALHPYLSPYRGDLAKMPPCIILFGEYDFLRFENEAYAKKLAESGVEVKTVRYRGLTHAFAEEIGVKPQAEDSLEETGNFMMKYLS